MDKVPICKNCGCKLKPILEREMVQSKFLAWKVPKGKVIDIKGYGYSGNGFFCSLRCGYYWAVKHFRK